MEGAITSIEALRKKFFDDGYPHWNLYGSDGKTMFAQNRKGGKVEMDESWKRLQDNIDSLNNPDGRLFKLQTFPNEGSNHGLTQWLQIYRNPSVAPAGQAVAGIGSLGIGGVEDIINTKIAIARLEMENDLLQQQLENQNEPSVWEKIFTPATVQGLLGALLRQAPAQVMSAPITGVPEQPQQPLYQEQTDRPTTHDEEDEIFKREESADLLCDTAETLGIDPDQLVEKLAALVQQNPEMAKSLIG